MYMETTKGSHRIIMGAGSGLPAVRQPQSALGVSAVERILSPIADAANGFGVTAWGVASDVSAVVRNCYWIQNPVNPDPGVVYGLGITSAMGVFTGPMAAAKGVLDLKTAKKTNDVASATFAKIAIAGGVAETAAGATMAVSRTLSLASLKTTSKVIEVAGPIFGWAASISISLSFLFSLVRSVKVLRAATNFRKELAAKGSVEEKFIYLLEQSEDPIKKAAYKRAVGGATLDELRKSTVDRAKVVAQVEADLKTQIFKQRLMVFAIVIGIASFVMTTVLTSGTMLIFGYALMLVMNMIMSGADAQGMYHSMMNIKNLSAKEKLVMAFFVMVTVAVTLAGIVFSGGAILGVPLIVGLAMLAIQGGGMAYAWHAHHRQPQKHLIDFPTDFGLDFIESNIQNSRDD
jgi:hypothetical protein